MPSATFDGIFLHEDIFVMAAAYFFYIVQNHPFIDGNKRTGAAVAIVFLKMNGLHFRIDNAEFVDLALEVAQGRLKKAADRRIFQAKYTALNRRYSLLPAEKMNMVTHETFDKIISCASPIF